MKEEDLEDFSRVMTTFLKSQKGITHIQDTCLVWWKAFQHFPSITIDDLERGLELFTIQTGNKYNTPPSPGKILELIIGNDEERAVSYFNRFIEAIAIFGTEFSLDLGDPVGNKTIQDMGGMALANRLNEDNLPFIKKEFINLYTFNMKKLISGQISEYPLLAGLNLNSSIIQLGDVNDYNGKPNYLAHNTG